MKCEDESVKYSTLREQVLVYSWPIKFTLVNETTNTVLCKSIANEIQQSLFFVLANFRVKFRKISCEKLDAHVLWCTIVAFNYFVE